MIDPAVLLIVELLLLCSSEYDIEESCNFLLIPRPVLEFYGLALIVFIETLFYKFLREGLVWKITNAFHFLGVVVCTSIVGDVWENDPDIFSWNEAIRIEVIPINEVSLSINLKFII